LSLVATSCRAASRSLAQLDLADSLELPPWGSQSTQFNSSIDVTPLRRLLDRAGYGPRPGDLARAAELGYEAYLEQQLHPEQVEDVAADLLIRNLTYYHMDASQLIDQDLEDVAQDLAVATVGRAIYSRRQLNEAMVEFWSDHFNIYVRKKRHILPLKVIDDRDVIRPHALGRFRDLLFASAQSPAMLVYLDNVRNTHDAINENYARELMELHTLGVHAGYTQSDVQDLARVLTGWGVQHRGPRKGQLRFYSDRHDQSDKRIFGQSVAAGQGQEEILQILGYLADHPVTAHFIATKLVRRFVADDPPAALIDRVAQTFINTGGDIRDMLRVILLSDDFRVAPDKLKRPYTFMISALRILNADIGHYHTLIRWLELLGQAPFLWPSPDGYPDDSISWSNNLLPRWNFSLSLMDGQVRGVHIPLGRILDAVNGDDVNEAIEFLGWLIFGRDLDKKTTGMIARYVAADELTSDGARQRVKEAIGLMLASPSFQWT